MKTHHPLASEQATKETIKLASEIIDKLTKERNELLEALGAIVSYASMVSYDETVLNQLVQQAGKVIDKVKGRKVLSSWREPDFNLKTMDANGFDRLQELKDRLFELETTMISTFTQQRDRNREMFEVCREIEQIENPKEYKKNKAHWEGHESRF